MIRKVGGSGSDEYAVGRNNKQPPVAKLANKVEGITNRLFSQEKMSETSQLQERVNSQFIGTDYLQHLKSPYTED